MRILESMWSLQEGGCEQLNPMCSVLGGFTKDAVAFQES